MRFDIEQKVTSKVPENLQIWSDFCEHPCAVHSLSDGQFPVQYLMLKSSNSCHKHTLENTSLLYNRGHVSCSPTASCTEGAKAACFDCSDWKHILSRPNHDIFTESGSSFFQMALDHVQAADMPPSANQDCCYSFQRCCCWYLMKLLDKPWAILHSAV